MTIATTTSRVQYAGNGAVTLFTFSFKVFATTDVLVILTDSSGTDATQVINTQYSVSLNADQNASPGGSVSMVAAPPSGYLLTLARQVTNTQGVSLPNGGVFYPSVIEDALDRQTILVQQLVERINRAISLPVSSAASGTIPIGVNGKLLGFDAVGNVIAYDAQTGTSLVSLAGSSGSSLIGYQAPFSGSVATTVQNRLANTVYVTDFGADPSGVIDSSPAINAAINYCMANLCKTIVYPSGKYLISSAINMTSDATHNRSSISHVSLGGRRSVTFICATSAWAIDLTGSAWTYWHGIMFQSGASNCSHGAFLLASTASNPECLHHTFDNVSIDLYSTSAPASFGTIGFGIIGSEENTFIGCEVYANSPVLNSIYYSHISADYPSTYQTIQAGHSSGVNTFSGETSLVTYDQKHAPVQLYGVNTLQLGNVYLANINVGTPGTNQYAISVLGGTLEGVYGNVKMEGLSSLLHIPAGCEIYGWDLKLQIGAGSSAAYPVMQIDTPGLGSVTKVIGFKLVVSYYIPTVSDFAGKKLIAAPGVSGATGNQVPILADFDVSVNQASSVHGYPFFDAQFCGIGYGCVMKFTDCTYTLFPHKHIKQYSGQMSVYPVNGSGAVIGTIYLPVATAGFGARNISVRISGLMSGLNDSYHGNEAVSTCCYFNTAKSAVSANDGVIVTAADGGSSSLLSNTTYIAVSTSPSYCVLTGAYLNMTYSAASRTITLTAIPTGTGGSTGGILPAITDLEVEMLTDGRTQELIYLV